MKLISGDLHSCKWANGLHFIILIFKLKLNCLESHDPKKVARNQS